MAHDGFRVAAWWPGERREKDYAPLEEELQPKDSTDVQGKAANVEKLQAMSDLEKGTAALEASAKTVRRMPLQKTYLWEYNVGERG